MLMPSHITMSRVVEDYDISGPAVGVSQPETQAASERSTGRILSKFRENMLVAEALSKQVNKTTDIVLDRWELGVFG
jgi:hypothetical protein